jgi:hypothetical protein
MKAIELEMTISKDGTIHLPDDYQTIYGQKARFVILLSEQAEYPKKKRQPGSAKGMLHVLAEDDEHLDDFREYMP